MKSELISVIIPVHNVEAHLDECLNSVVNQTYHNLEIILLDDGSTDKSGRICDDWAKQDERIRVIHKENEGIAATRNKGLEVAKGAYIAWVDSDDYVDLQLFEKLYDLLVSSGADMSMCNFYGLYGDTLTFDGKTRIFDALYSAEEFLEQVYTTGFFSVVWNKLVPRGLYSDIHFPDGRRFEDSAIMRELVMKCQKIATSKEPLYYYRRHEKSITMQEKSPEEAAKYLEEYCQWLEDDIAFFADNENGKLMSQASKFLCNAIILQYGELAAKDQRVFKKKYNLYVKHVLSKKDYTFKVKLKYFIAYISIALYNKLSKING